MRCPVGMDRGASASSRVTTGGDSAHRAQLRFALASNAHPQNPLRVGLAKRTSATPPAHAGRAGQARR
jgi:hypothetical protein